MTDMEPAAPVVRETPLYVEPIPSPRLFAPAQEASFPEPGPLAPQAVGTSFITINLQDQFNAFGPARSRRTQWARSGQITSCR